MLPPAARLYPPSSSISRTIFGDSCLAAVERVAQTASMAVSQKEGRKNHLVGGSDSNVAPPAPARFATRALNGSFRPYRPVQAQLHRSRQTCPREPHRPIRQRQGAWNHVSALSKGSPPEPRNGSVFSGSFLSRNSLSSAESLDRRLASFGCWKKRRTAAQPSWEGNPEAGFPLPMCQQMTILPAETS